MRKRMMVNLLVVAFLVAESQSNIAIASTGNNEIKKVQNENVAGGFYAEENPYSNIEKNYFFETKTKQDAVQIVDTYDLEGNICTSSNNIIVQTDLTSSQKERLDKDERIEDVERDYMVYGCSDSIQNSENSSSIQWNLDAMNISTNEQTTPKDKIKVELLDSGVSYVSALENVNRIDLTSENEVNNITEVLMDDNSGHGTALAGIIASNTEIKGINPNVDLYSVKILDEKLQAPISKVIEGIYWGIEHHVNIINMSFGTEVDSPLLHEAIQKAEAEGILLVAAAGNHSDKGILYPAAYPEVIAVGAIDSNNELLADSANGDSLELVAPGDRIVSTGMFDGYITGSGTSLAAAEVTGVASLLMEEKGASSVFVRKLLGITAKSINSTKAGLIDYEYAKQNYKKFYQEYMKNSVTKEDFENLTELCNYSTDQLVNGLWTTDTHEWLVNKADESVILNSTYVTIVAYAARKADDTNSYHPTNNQKYNGLHGLGVYTSNFYALWKFANYINKGDTTSKAKDSSLNSLPTKALQAEQKMEDSGKDYTTKNMLNACSLLVESDAEAKKLGYQETNAKKKYLIVGFGCHMIGDIYAHRTLVPQYAIDNAKSSVPSGEKYASGSSTDFASYLVKSDFDKWSELLTAHDNGNLTFPQLKYYAKDATHFNAKYEDNSNFCRERLNATLKCTKQFLSRISSADKNIATTDIIQNQTNVSLINYDNYMNYFK